MYWSSNGKIAKREKKGKCKKILPKNHWSSSLLGHAHFTCLLFYLFRMNKHTWAHFMVETILLLLAQLLTAHTHTYIYRSGMMSVCTRNMTLMSSQNRNEMKSIILWCHQSLHSRQKALQFSMAHSRLKTFYWLFDRFSLVVTPTEKKKIKEERKTHWKLRLTTFSWNRNGSNTYIGCMH